MNTLAWLAATGWAAFLILAALFVIVRLDNAELTRRLKSARAVDHSDCRADIANAVEVADRWKRKAMQGSNVTPSWMPERPTLTQGEHLADAIERVEYGPVGAERRGMSLPGAEVIPMQRKGQ